MANQPTSLDLERMRAVRLGRVRHETTSYSNPDVYRYRYVGTRKRGWGWLENVTFALCRVFAVDYSEIFDQQQFAAVST